MAKALHCRDLGVSCDFSAKGETESEVLQKAAQHAQEAHGMATMNEETMGKVRSAIHEESSACSGCCG